MGGQAGTVAPSRAGALVVLERGRMDAVLLDLDGVLTDTRRLHEAAWRITLDAFLARHAARGGAAFRPVEAGDYRTHLDGLPRHDGIRAFLAARGIMLAERPTGAAPGADSVAGLAAAKNEAFRVALAREGVQALPGARALLARLAEAGVATAVVTASRNAPAVIAAAGLAGTHDLLVDGTVAAGLVLPGKPAPHVFLEAARRLGVPAWRAAVIEDATSGIAAARAGGFAEVVGIGTGAGAEALAAAGADAVVADPAGIAIAGTPAPADGVASAPPPADLARVLGARQPALFLDYDGTLTPIVDRPEAARLAPAMRATLARLARLMPVAVVSGRARADLAALLGLEGLVLAGAHGLDVAGPEGSGLRAERGGACRDSLRDAADALRRRLDGIAGVLVEDKGLALAVHYRLVAPVSRPRVFEAVEDVLAPRPDLRRSDGKMVVELRPRIDWDKGRAVLWLVEALGLDPHLALPICLGDDTTDEDAFAAIRGSGLGILVAETPRPTAARCRLDDVAAVGRFLERLACTMEARDG